MNKSLFVSDNNSLVTKYDDDTRFSQICHVVIEAIQIKLQVDSKHSIPTPKLCTHVKQF